MVITIKDENNRFGVRVAAVIFNKNKTKIFVQRQGEHDYYMLPGGRLDIHEEAEVAIKRELIEELGIETELKLKYVAENFIKFPNLQYHEIGFYFITSINEEQYGYDENKEYDSKDESHDGKSIFKWLDVNEIDSYEIMPKVIKEKIVNKDVFKEKIEHFVYREY